MKAKSIKQRIMEYFFVHPTARLRVRQIERVVKVPLPSVIRYTKELEAERIIYIIDIAGVKTFAADRTSKRFLLEKKLFNIRSLFHSELIVFLVKEYSNPTIVVFGSYSKGEDVEESDIDLYIESPQKVIKPMPAFEKKLQRKIQIFHHKNIQSIKNKDLANNIINGIVLNGFLEVLK